MNIKKRLLVIGLALTLSISMIACNRSDDEPEEEVARIEEVEEQEITALELGDTWEVEDSWKLTVTDIVRINEDTEPQEKFADLIEETKELIMVEYKYEDLQYEMDAEKLESKQENEESVDLPQDLEITPINIESDNGIVGNEAINPQITWSNGESFVQLLYAFDEKVDVLEIFFKQYDSNDNIHKAIYNCPVE